MKADTDQRLMLGVITDDQANAATATITRHATDRADLARLMRMIQPAPHQPDTTPADRRATPRWER
jgi:hypothetical protein